MNQNSLPLSAERKSNAIADWAKNGQPLQEPLPPGTLLCGIYDTLEVIECLPNAKTDCGREGTFIRTKILRKNDPIQCEDTIPFLRNCGSVLRAPNGDPFCPMTADGTPLLPGWSPAKEGLPYMEKESYHGDKIIPILESDTCFVDEGHTIYEKVDLSQNPLETHHGRKQELETRVRALILKSEAQATEDSLLEGCTRHAKIIVRVINRLGRRCQHLAEEKNFAALAKEREKLDHLLPDLSKVPERAYEHLDDDASTACQDTLWHVQREQKDITIHEDSEFLATIESGGRVFIHRKTPEGPFLLSSHFWNDWEEKKTEILEKHTETLKKPKKSKKSPKKDEEPLEVAHPTGEKVEEQKYVLCEEVAPGIFSTKIVGFGNRNGMHGAVSETGYHSQLATPQEKWADLQKSMAEKSRQHKKGGNPLSNICKEALNIAGRLNLLNLVQELDPNPDQTCFTAYHAAHSALSELMATKAWRFAKTLSPRKDNTESLLDLLLGGGDAPHAPGAKNDSIDWLLSRQLLKLGKNVKISQEIEGIRLSIVPISGHQTQWDDQRPEHTPLVCSLHLQGTITAHLKDGDKVIPHSSFHIAEAARSKKTMRDILEREEILEKTESTEVEVGEVIKTTEAKASPQLELF